MAKKRPTPKTKAAKPKRKSTTRSRPPRGGGGDRPRARAASPRKDSAAEDYSQWAAYADGSEPLTDEVAEQIGDALLENAVGDLSDEGRRIRTQLARKLVEFRNDKITKILPPGTPPAVKSVDNGALEWIAARCTDGFFASDLERVITHLIKSGYLFRGGAGGDVVWTIMERLYEDAAGSPEDGKSELPADLATDPSVAAQEALAGILAAFIAPKVISSKIVLPRVLQVSQLPGFKRAWARFRRQDKPHNRVQLDFVFDCAAMLDAAMEEVLDGPLAYREGEFPAPRTEAAPLMHSIEETRPALAATMNAILDEIEERQRASHSMLGHPWVNAWYNLRSRDAVVVVALAEPFVRSEWEKRKKSMAGANLDGNHWAIVWKRLAKVLETLYREWRIPPLRLEDKGWIVEKHAMRTR